MMNKIVTIWMSCLIVLPSLLGLFNYISDPNYYFGNNFELNVYRSGYNERQMKANYLSLDKQVRYDSLILGASRTTYLNATSFKDQNVFNFSVSNMTSQEFIDYAIFFEQKNSTPKNIYLFVDFVGMLLQQESLIDETLSNINNPEYVFSNLLSFTSLKRSLNNTLRSYKRETGHRAYLHNLDVAKDRVNTQKSKENIKNLANIYYKEYENKEKIDESSLIYKENLYEFSAKFSNSKITVTTTPISDQFLSYIYSNDLLFETFIAWISLLCEVFGEINFMTYKNNFTSNFELHSWDGNHIYPETFEDYFMVVNMSNLQYTKVLNKDNVSEYLNGLRQEKLAGNRINNI